MKSTDFKHPVVPPDFLRPKDNSKITAIVTEWLKDGCGKSIEEIAGIISECIFGRDSKIEL